MKNLVCLSLGKNFYVADPGFPGVWAATPKVGVKSYYLVNFFPKIYHENR